MSDLLICTGDSSADQYAANVVEYLTDQGYPGEIHAAAGHLTERAGANLLMNLVDYGVVGVSEILGSVPAYYRAFRKLDQALQEFPIQTVLLMDFPGFNLQVLARWIRFKGYQVNLCYYIPPQVWAWRQGRVAKLRDWFDDIFVIFPFEQSFYRERGVEARFVGHPKLEEWSDTPEYDLRETLQLDDDQRIVGFFAGSRGSEVDQHLPEMARAADKLVQRHSNVVPVFSAAPTVKYDHYEKVLTGDRHHEYPVWGADARSLLEASEVVMLASGTITMDATFCQTPMVVGYRTSWFSYLIGRWLIQTNNVGMPNLLDEEAKIPELIQSEFSADQLAMEVSRLLEDEDEANRQRNALKDICQQFSAREPSREVGDRLLEIAEL